MKRIWACGFATAYCVVAATYAASIPVPNFSFSDPDVADANLSTTVPGWTLTLGGGGNSAGVRDPLNAQYAGSTGNNALLPGTADGGQAAYFSLNEGFGRLSMNVTTIQ